MVTKKSDIDLKPIITHTTHSIDKDTGEYVIVAEFIPPKKYISLEFKVSDDGNELEFIEIDND